MKNKEIKEMIQNRIDDIYQSGEYISQAKELEEILEYIKQLENNRDKAIEFGNGLLLGEATFEERHIASRFLNILKGDSDEQ